MLVILPNSVFIREWYGAIKVEEKHFCFFAAHFFSDVVKKKRKLGNQRNEKSSIRKWESWASFTFGLLENCQESGKLIKDNCASLPRFLNRFNRFKRKLRAHWNRVRFPQNWNFSSATPLFQTKCWIARLSPVIEVSSEWHIVQPPPISLVSLFLPLWILMIAAGHLYQCTIRSVLCTLYKTVCVWSKTVPDVTLVGHLCLWMEGAKIHKRLQIQIQIRIEDTYG